MSVDTSIQNRSEPVEPPLSKLIIKETIKVALATGLGFGFGCLAGRIVNGPVLIVGAIAAVATLAQCILSLVAQQLANKFGWNLSTVNFVVAISGAVLSVAAVVTAFALGIFNPVGLGVGIGMSLLFASIPLGFGIYAKATGKDLPYAEAVKEARNDETSYYNLSLNFGT